MEDSRSQSDSASATTRWVAAEVDQWMAQRLEERDALAEEDTEDEQELNSKNRGKNEISRRRAA
jgi:hypothetical protein